MGKAAAFIAVAALTVFLILRFVSPLLLKEQGTENRKQDNSGVRVLGIKENPNPLTPRYPNTLTPTTPTPQSSIEPPRSSERRNYEDIEAKRSQFYASLRASFQYILNVRPAPDDQAILEIYMTTDDPYASSDVVQKGVMPDAARNGFEKVRLFQPNTAGGAEPYRLDAEATMDRNGVWTTFRH